MDPTPDPALDRTPDPVIVFAILHATSQIVESVRKILDAEDHGLGHTSDIRVVRWFDLGCFVWRLGQLLDLIHDPEGDIPVAGWPYGVDTGLCGLRDRFDHASEDSNEIARTLGGDLNAVLEHCCGKKGTFPEIHFVTALRPFQRAFELAVDDRDESLWELTVSVWDEWMPDPHLSEMKRNWECATNGRAPEALAPATPANHFELVAAAPSENGTAEANGRGPAPPADRPELVAAPPSGNGTATTEAPTNGHDIEAPAAAPENSTSETTHPGPPVALNGPDGEVIVWGKPMGVLPDAEYRVVKALVDAYALEQPLSMSELRNRTKDARGNVVEDPVGALKRLRAKAPVWKQAIGMSGKARRGYKLIARRPALHPPKPNKPPTKTQ